MQISVRETDIKMGRKMIIITSLLTAVRLWTEGPGFECLFRHGALQ